MRVSVYKQIKRASTSLVRETSAQNCVVILQPIALLHNLECHVSAYEVLAAFHLSARHPKKRILVQ